MLKSLRISNFALINKLELSLENGLNIITGETGAGKSVIVGAISLLMGERFDRKVLYDENKKCVLELEVELNPIIWDNRFKSWDLDFFKNTIIRREILTNGRSRSFINDTPCKTSILKEIKAALIDIHEQNQVLSLYKTEHQLNLLDSYGELSTINQQFELEYNNWKIELDALENLKIKWAQHSKDRDYWQFLYEELDKLELNEEITTLESDALILENAEQLIEGFNSSKFLMDESDQSIIRQLEQIYSYLSSSCNGVENFNSLLERINSLIIEAKDLMFDFEEKEGQIEHNPEKLHLLREQIDIINRLLLKHQVKTVKELKKIKLDLENKIVDIQSYKEKITLIEKTIDQYYKNIFKLGNELSSKRKTAALNLEKEINSLLPEVGITYGKIKVCIDKKQKLSKRGLDQISLLFSPDNGNKFLPMEKIASGGEMSRLLLSIKFILSKKSLLPTMLMDEIDTGISGEVAKKIGVLLKKMGERAQLICISHLPQISSKGKAHFHVFKQNDAKGFQQTLIKTLSNEERIYELARMLSGDKPSKSALNNAEELLSY